MSKPNIPSRAGKGCPTCGKRSVAPFSPFCSQGCRDRDLLRWLGDGYRLPGRPTDEMGREIDPDGLDSEA